MKITRNRLFCCTFALITGSSMNSGMAKDTPMELSCRQFVQSFYSWYKPEGKDDSPYSTEDAIKKKTNDFDPELRRKLQDDCDAQAKAEGEIVGLDMDPFLNTNSDPYQRYITGKITPKAGAYLVEVYGINSGKKTNKPIVIPEARYKDKHWQFVNFHYGKSNIPVNENLVSILKCLREDRDKNSKR
ncbi:MAG TPA: hypothetical protein V6C72_01190 [Chroococcales cyanobacterium]